MQVDSLLDHLFRCGVVALNLNPPLPVQPGHILPHEEVHHAAPLLRHVVGVGAHPDRVERAVLQAL